MPRNSKTTAGRAKGRTSSKAATYNEESKLKELFVEELKDIYSAEKQLTKALPKMAKAATSEELANAFEKPPGPDRRTNYTGRTGFRINGNDGESKKM